MPFCRQPPLAAVFFFNALHRAEAKEFAESASCFQIFPPRFPVIDPKPASGECFQGIYN